MKPTPALGVVTALLVLPLSGTASAQTGPLAGLDAYVERAKRDWEVPGLAITVVRNDSVVYARGFGVREIGRDARVDERTLFAVGSTTKAFTAAALAMLVDSGRVRWDDRVTEHLPGFQLFDPYVTRELTVRDLLSHRSGLPRGDRLWYGGFPYGREEILRRVRHLRPSWSFRARYGYQNIMFLAAGQVVAAVSGQSWDDFVRERIFRPLGMTTTNTSTLALRGVENVATPHERIEDRMRPVAWRNLDNMGPAGSINSSVADMAEWLRLQLGNGVYGGRRLLSAAVMREMHAAQTAIASDERTDSIFPEVHLRSYGLGWSLQDYKGRKVVQHGGAIDGMRAQVGMMPEERLGVVLLANGDVAGSLLVGLVLRVFDLHVGAPQRDWSADLLTAMRAARQRAEAERRRIEAARVPGTRPSLPLGAYAGAYVDSLYGEATVAEEGGRLVLRASPSFVGDLEHWHFDTFRVTWRERRLGRSFVTFVLDTRGKVARMAVEAADTATYDRAAEPATRRRSP